jgi:hypothetical protein
MLRQRGGASREGKKYGDSNIEIFFAKAANNPKEVLKDVCWTGRKKV